MPGEPKKSSLKHIILMSLFNNLFITIIVGGALAYFGYISSENLQHSQTINQIRIDSLNKIHEARLNEIQKEKDNSTQKLLEEYVKDLELKNEIQLLGKSYEVELQKINAQLRNDSILQVESINTDNEKDLNRARLN
ncbi:hypothetical protein R9C00_00960 [Flammeovirgaceae bacterium SG7u.111]|nr:hypothetical protein [Flammeovirgaceae bacterium SG7u.132]WPO36019.1 hypothetical protein R9C00_00960 [Flammeovirgaceae bacterium SG7u.111]